MTAPKTEGRYTAEFILMESPGTISRDQIVVTVPTGRKLSPGHVLSRLAASPNKYVPYDNAGSDGSEAAYGILYDEADNTAGLAPADFAAVAVNWGAEVRRADLAFESGASAGDKTAAYADLAARGVKVRD